MDARPTAQKTAATRGRPAGRTAFQEEQRRQTRAAIMAAAAEVFSNAAYVYATIDDITRAAGISRATFYMHFESKLALAFAIYEDISQDWQEHFDKLSEPGQTDPANLKPWVQRLSGIYVDHGYVTSLVSQLEIFEPAFRARLRQDRLGLIDYLGDRGLSGFAKARGAAKAAQLRRAEGALLLRRLDQICGDLAHPDALSPEDAEIYTNIAVKELNEFINGN